MLWTTAMTVTSRVKSKPKQRLNRLRVALNTSVRTKFWTGLLRSAWLSSIPTIKRFCIAILNLRISSWPSVALSSLEILVLQECFPTPAPVQRLLSAHLTIFPPKLFVKKATHSSQIFGLSEYFFTRLRPYSPLLTLVPSISWLKRLFRASTSPCPQASLTQRAH